MILNNLNLINLNSRLIVFSGIDGSGKSTQINILRKSLNDNGFKTISFWARGGYTPGFVFLKRIISKYSGNKIITQGNTKRREGILSISIIKNIWLILAVIDLFVFWVLYIRFLLLINKVVICDRYICDTFIDFKINFPYSLIAESFLWKLLYFSVPKTPCSFYLDINFEESIRRSTRKSEPFPEIREKAFNRYQLYNNSKYSLLKSYKIINANLDITSVSEEISNNVFNFSNRSF